MNEMIQKLVLENVYKSDKYFANQLQNVSEQERGFIEQNKLHNLRIREEIGWKLQGYIEKIMYEESNYDDIEVISAIVAKKWNEQETLQLVDSAIEAYILRLFKSINHRKAFGELCESDMESYKLFIQDSSLFAQCVIRQLFTYDHVPLKNILPVFTWVFKAHFDENAGEVFRATIKQLSLYTEKNQHRIIGGKAGAQGRLAKAMALPFIPAIEKLYVQLFEKSNKKELDRAVVYFMNDYVLGKKVPVQSKQTEQEVVQKQPVEAVTELPKEVPASALAETPVSPNEHAVIDQMIAQLQQLKTTITTPQKPTVNEEMNDQLKIAEEEIARLRQTLMSQEAKLKEMKEQTYEQLIDVIGGARSNYLLSELYKESMDESALEREIIQGQLLNLFNILGNVMQLEPMTHGYQIGEEFDCDRSTLAHQFRILNTISSDEDQVRVKLLQYGWSMNNKVIVYPQVIEMKGVH